MSFLKSLFGLGKSQRVTHQATPELDYNGYTIEATPMMEGSQFQVCGVVRRYVDGAIREHRFIRVDKLSFHDDAVALIFIKGQQIVDQMGDKMFE